MDEFDQVAADLEKAIKDGKADADLLKSADVQEAMKDPKKLAEMLRAGAASLAKAKGAQPTDLKQEEAPKDKDVTDDEDGDNDPPVKSGRGYRDTRSYVGKNARVGKGDDDADDDGDDDDMDDDKKKPSFFGKKAKKSGKAKKGDESADDDHVDITEDVEQMGKALDFIAGAVHDLKKGLGFLAGELDEVKEGSAIFGQVLKAIAEQDPRRDNLITTMAKADNVSITMLKSMDDRLMAIEALIKSVATMPGAPRAVGLAVQKSEAAAGDPNAPINGHKVSEGDRSRLMKARTSGKITQSEWKHAVTSGDVSILNKAQ